MLREERKEESESVRVRMASGNEVGREEGKYLKRKKEARGKSVVNELPHPRVIVLEAYLGN